jgi:hypothetical protein
MPFDERVVAATAGHLPGRGGKVHEERIRAERVLEMANEAARRYVTHGTPTTAATGAPIARQHVEYHPLCAHASPDRGRNQCREMGSHVVYPRSCT